MIINHKLGDLEVHLVVHLVLVVELVARELVAHQEQPKPISWK